MNALEAVLRRCELVRRWFADHVDAYTWEALEGAFPGVLPLHADAVLLDAQPWFDPHARHVIDAHQWEHHITAGPTVRPAMYEWYMSRFVLHTSPCDMYRAHIAHSNEARAKNNTGLCMYIFTTHCNHLGECFATPCITAFVRAVRMSVYFYACNADGVRALMACRDLQQLPALVREFANALRKLVLLAQSDVRVDVKCAVMQALGPSAFDGMDLGEFEYIVMMDQPYDALAVVFKLAPPVLLERIAASRTLWVRVLRAARGSAHVRNTVTFCRASEPVPGWRAELDAHHRAFLDQPAPPPPPPIHASTTHNATV